jgi:hypothetical protein
MIPQCHERRHQLAMKRDRFRSGKTHFLHNVQVRSYSMKRDRFHSEKPRVVAADTLPSHT